jgi:hypothetical protein
MKEAGGKLAERLRVEGEKVVAFFRALEPHAWDQKIYSDGNEWKIYDILAHFVSSEKAFNLLIFNITSGGKGAPVGFNIDEFNEKEVEFLKETSKDQLLRDFSDLRSRNAALVDRLSIGDLAKIGRHPFLGEASLEDIIKLIYRHNQIHLRDVRRAVQA